MAQDKENTERILRPLPTLSDVAQAAGVALSTASKALNGQGKLRPETRERVLEAAKQLGFRPNDLAQSLVRGRSFTVGLLSTDNYGRFSIPLVTGIEDALVNAQISVFLCNTLGSPEREQQHLDSLLAKHVDGIIVTSDRTNSRAPIDLGKLDLPVIYAYTRVEDPNVLCILPDDEQGARLAVEHLIKQGRRHFAHITGPVYFEAVQLRAKEMRAVLGEHDIPFTERRVLSGAWEESWGYEAANILLDRDPLIDAIFCGSDQIARGVVDGLRERGIRVPEDIAITGFDNWEVMATAVRPPLTTVDLNLHELGKLAGTRLLQMIDGQRPTGIERVPCSLVVRESSAAQSKSIQTKSKIQQREA
ncbi:LacI family transcriptional regulator [Dictyobacter alpinus]|uniref:LacI family transcriptional regulator n=1 Tax=Dictyobacter alpinus TaxID=2014873 RepID=A0A402BJQ3_9CHLR|nr:LacI family DNA-binding transcriptional regulator [Dictyobacter alpinus]GCE31577.1 LacI family transcriptional regulator [Dictyobacter alpinus]